MLLKSHSIHLYLFSLFMVPAFFLSIWKAPFPASARSSSSTTFCTKKYSDIATGKQITHSVKNAKKRYLPHTKIKVKKSLNPWTFTITLSSSRILLKREVAKSKLLLSSKKKKSFIVTVPFTKLSKNGKKLTYRIPASKRHLFCPGNSSRNGTYFIKSSLFPKKLSVNYTERLTKQTISGFVLQQNGRPIKNAFIHLKTASKVLTSHTDKNGYYNIDHVKNPSSLTVSKTGYDKNTISSLKISKKGVICENIILKPTKDNLPSIHFFITDTNNRPLPNATVQIFSAAKRVSSKKTNFSSCFDSFLKKEQLLCAKSNSNGKLSFTDIKNKKTFPCTKMVWEETMQLSYINSYSPDLSNRSAIGNKINTKDQYIIYVSDNAVQNNSIESYNTVKLTFSFSLLHTNHLLIHIKLKKAPFVNTKNLSIKLDSSFDSSSCEFLDLSIYHKSNQIPFYRTILEKNTFILSKDILSLPAYLSVALPEDTYYIRLCAKSKDASVIGASSITSVAVKNGAFLPCRLQLQSSCYSRILTFCETEKEVTTNAFNLYQIYNGMYFLLDRFNTDSFTWSAYHMQTASLITAGMVCDEKYLLYPASSNFITTNNPIIAPTADKLWKSSEETLLSAPLCQISCQADHSKPYAVPVFPDFSNQTFDIIYNRQYTLNQTTLRKSAAYPNTVLAFYKKNGTFLTISLTASNQNISAFHIPKHSVLDIYRNSEILTTSQDSYQKK